MARNKDVRLKLTDREHTILAELAKCSRLTLQDYIERLIGTHINRRLAEATRLAAVADVVNERTPPSTKRVYFIQRGGSEGPIKIGITKSVVARVAALQTGSEEPLAVLHQCEPNGILTEKKLHQRFRELRLEGEWFRPTTELREFIESLKSPRSELAREVVLATPGGR